MTIDDIWAGVEHAGAAMEAAATMLAAAVPEADCLPVTAVGRLGEVGQGLHRLVEGAITIRADEAGAHTARLAETADALQGATVAYREVDAGASQRHRGETT